MYSVACCYTFGYKDTTFSWKTPYFRKKPYLCTCNGVLRPLGQQLRNTLVMKSLTAKIMVSLACAIIFMHAVVPHHHHDCDGERGFVFETELDCHCHHDGDGCASHDDATHSHHPFDMCKLAEMLSHLVLSTKDDETLFAALFKADVHELFYGMAYTPLEETLLTLANSQGHSLPAPASLLPKTPYVGTPQLRGPPLA